MKKGFIIGVGVTVLTLLLLAPWVVGLFVEQRVLAEMGRLLPETDYHYTRNWRRSRLEVRLSDGSTLLAHGHHAPWAPPALASFQGALLPAGQPEPVEFTGRLSLGGGVEMSAAMAGLEWAQEGISMAAENLALKIVSGASVHQLDFTAASLEILTGGRLHLEHAGVELHWRSLEDKARLAAALTARRRGYPASELEFSLKDIAREPLGVFIETAHAWDEVRHDELNRDLALLIMASAWQELRQQGLTMELPVLELDGDFRLAGRWRFDGPHEGNRIEGGGSRATVEAWLAPFFATGENGVDELLTMFQEQEWVVDRGGQMSVSLP